MSENTQDLSNFGYREIKMAIKLLEKYIEKPEILESGVAIEFNPDSGSVFLVDENYCVAMLNGDNLEEWFNCPYCGHEGFKENMNHEPEDEECTEYLKEIGVLPKEE